ncbi:MAG: CoA-binding protein [Saprospiraceae bacterium]|jgi:predicted CoA-binding protein|nr:CoA-binding protein [Saprospiraceae bacterium]
MNSKNKKTLVLGGSENPERYSNMAIRLLRKNEIEVVSVGRKKGKVLDVEIMNTPEAFEEIHTITLYVGTKNQNPYFDYILGLKPKRIIFNPGTENDTLRSLAESEGIETEEACTLVLLNLRQY